MGKHKFSPLAVPTAGRTYTTWTVKVYSILLIITTSLLFSTVRFILLGSTMGVAVEHEKSLRDVYSGRESSILKDPYVDLESAFTSFGNVAQNRTLSKIQSEICQEFLRSRYIIIHSLAEQVNSALVALSELILWTRQLNFTLVEPWRYGNRIRLVLDRNDLTHPRGTPLAAIYDTSSIFADNALSMPLISYSRFLNLSHGCIKSAGIQNQFFINFVAAQTKAKFPIRCSRPNWACTEKIMSKNPVHDSISGVLQVLPALGDPQYQIIHIIGYYRHFVNVRAALPLKAKDGWESIVRQFQPSVLKLAEDVRKDFFGKERYLAAHFRTERLYTFPMAVPCVKETVRRIRSTLFAMNATKLFIATDVFQNTSETYHETNELNVLSKNDILSPKSAQFTSIRSYLRSAINALHVLLPDITIVTTEMVQGSLLSRNITDTVYSSIMDQLLCVKATSFLRGGNKCKGQLSMFATAVIAMRSEIKIPVSTPK